MGPWLAVGAALSFPLYLIQLTEKISCDMLLQFLVSS